MDLAQRFRNNEGAGQSVIQEAGERVAAAIIKSILIMGILLLVFMPFIAYGQEKPTTIHGALICDTVEQVKEVAERLKQQSGDPVIGCGFAKNMMAHITPVESFDSDGVIAIVLRVEPVNSEVGTQYSLGFAAPTTKTTAI